MSDQHTETEAELYRAVIRSWMALYSLSDSEQDKARQVDGLLGLIATQRRNVAAEILRRCERKAQTGPDLREAMHELVHELHTSADEMAPLPVHTCTCPPETKDTQS